MEKILDTSSIENTEEISSIKFFFKTLRPYAIIFSAALLIIYLINAVFHIAFVSGDSMYPTLHNGDIVTCTTDLSILHRGDIIVYKLESGERVIKRIIALPQDKIKIVNGQPFVNDKISPYQYDDITDAGIIFENGKEIILNDNQYFCLGDNRNESADCRIYGPIYKKQILYKVNNVYSLFNINED